ncbi:MULTISPECIES: hypothetical protein [Bacillus cereus group]|uniref:hypothetical protein n=1 Tax=Bacillus cereus group TaxID=86661 RepID=UPI0005CE30E9|nr:MULTISPECIES: hypothetical protein [Bacillus cereus group]
MDKAIVFEAKKDIYWEDWGHLRKVFSKGKVYQGTLHKSGKVTAETPYYEGISDYIDLDSIEIRFRLHDWVIHEKAQSVFKILEIYEFNGLAFLRDDCGDTGDIEAIEECRLATEKEIEKEQLRRKREKVCSHIEI